ncbi:MAG: M20/M25/M40 family metallo-hydrolase [Deltaproteobacteria bacterium]|nr:M20/M25/M40 family metallo-hydrolase [Deltaproteobacteria bacterium]MBW2120327.1 M20/M25/M40 family metallo-hydrolase [Deltaproteobacteria bacterium]
MRSLEESFVRVLGELVGINSVNRSLAKGPGEEEISRFVYRYLADQGLKPEIQSVEEKRTNVVALAPGRNQRNPVLLNAHLDTVGVEEMAHPFTLRREGDRLYGRGTYDMKGGMAVMLLLARHFARKRPPADIWFTFVADEEDRSMGMEHLVGKWLPCLPSPPLGGIFLEPTEGQIGVSHKGFVWYEIEVTGKAAHGSRPTEGIDAILPLKGALQELDRIRSKLEREKPDPLLGRASLHGGLIEGGTAVSVIPSRSRLRWERRTLPRESPDTFEEELKRVLQAVRNVPGNHWVDGRIMLVRPPYEIQRKSRILRCLQEVSPESRLVGLSFWADSALAGRAGVPSLLFGPAGHGAHAADEWVSLKSLVDVYETLKRLLTASCWADD